jgi:hypothetical protein
LPYSDDRRTSHFLETSIPPSRATSKTPSGSTRLTEAFYLFPLTILKSSASAIDVDSGAKTGSSDFFHSADLRLLRFTWHWRSPTLWCGDSNALTNATGHTMYRSR